ncbi:F-box kelch-repeat At3g23880-like [Olea europaea subsp. europaea]|uniref:F-box kelch-repeat At3g23880-like n=1 Tax=Olea europaea subsp. europaea TaxID=158383 RepID=A0A8S0QW84_OLEEU|nr:F-box kelch-repeat At3g23880-like [Olea europaea subsp. europaea]
MAANLPWDITMDILSRLPVKSLMRFKCVSKSFYSLISQDSDFKRKHLDQSAKHNSTTTRAILDLEHAPERHFSCSLSSLSSDELVRQVMVELDNPVKGAKRKVYNSCDGLLCIKDTAGNVCIWNPSTRELKRLPDCLSANSRIGYGLGYDSSSGDYKVLSIYRSSRGHGGNELQLCSLKRDSSWRKIQGFPCVKLGFGDRYIFFNGAFYWIAETGGRCSTESFDLWVIEEYGAMESLKKILSIRVDKKLCTGLQIFKLLYLSFQPLYLFEDVS